MVKEINEEWAKQVIAMDENKSTENSPSKIDWVRCGSSFQKEIRFKVLPANSRENKIFSYITGMHWNIGPNSDKFAVCTEQTMHLKHLGIKCPICEAKRKLLSMGFKNEDLCTQGKFGPAPVFDPVVSSNVKVVVISSDLKEWDCQHVSILQQKSSFLTKWLINQYNDTNVPDFLAWENSNIFKFSRERERGNWERTATFATFNPTSDVIQKLKEENEALYMPDIWKAPNDTEYLELKDLADKMVQGYLNARDALADATKQTLAQTSSNEAVTVSYAQPVQSVAPTVQMNTATPVMNSYNSSAAVIDDDDIPF